MVFLSLIHNISLLVTLVIIHEQFLRFWKRNLLFYQIMSGLLFGCVVVVGMMTPLKLLPGVFFDGRSIILGVAGFIGGPISGIISGLIAASYRIYLGGSGILMGVSVISESALFGIGYYFLRRQFPGFTRWYHLWAFGYLIHLTMLGGTVL
jgi:LytS/YehU family sensor histidine kinase